MSSDMKTTYAGAEGILQQTKGKLTIRNEKSSRLTNSVINSFPLPSLATCRTRYETECTVSVVSFNSSSLGVNAMYKIHETRIFNDNMSSI